MAISVIKHICGRAFLRDLHYTLVSDNATATGFCVATLFLGKTIEDRMFDWTDDMMTIATLKRILLLAFWFPLFPRFSTISLWTLHLPLLRQSGGLFFSLGFSADDGVKRDFLVLA
jgi:hypothetical protein